MQEGTSTSDEAEEVAQGKYEGREGEIIKQALSFLDYRWAAPEGLLDGAKPEEVERTCEWLLSRNKKEANGIDSDEPNDKQLMAAILDQLKKLKPLIRVGVVKMRFFMLDCATLFALFAFQCVVFSFRLKMPPFAAQASTTGGAR